MGIRYTITQSSEWVDPGAATGACSGGASARPKFLRFTLSVVWPDMRGTAPVKSQTIITPPVTTYDAYTGAIKASVAGSAPGNIPVSISGPENATQNTTAEGCVFIPYLSAGSYTLTLNANGFVDWDGKQLVTEALTVAVGQVADGKTIPYDQAATIIVAMSTPSGGLLPKNLPLTIFNTSLTGFKKSIAAPVPPATVRQLTSLFPFTSGYQIWPGDCNEADPEATDAANAALWPGPAKRNTAVVSQPSGTTTTNLSVPEATVLATVGGVAAALPLQLQAVEARAVPDCRAGGQTLNFDPITTSIAPPLAVVGLPFGKWDVTATRTDTGAKKQVTVTLDPNVPTPPTMTFAF